MYRLATSLLCLAAQFGVAGCEPERNGDGIPDPTLVNLSGTTWQIEDIDEAGIIDRSMITLQFPEAGRVAGSTGCNRYFGSVSIDGDRLSFSQLGSTRRACAPAIAAQEQRFLEAIQVVARYRMENPEILILLDEADVRRLRGVRMQNDPATDGGTGKEPQDRGAETAMRLDCADSGIVAIRFLGPETIEMTRSSTKAVLARERSASGARYSGDGIEFWNKGVEAMLEIDGERVSCTRTE